MASRLTKDSHNTEFKHSTDTVDKFKSINIPNTKPEIRITNTDNGDFPGSSRNRSNKRPASITPLPVVSKATEATAASSLNPSDRESSDPSGDGFALSSYEQRKKRRQAVYGRRKASSKVLLRGALQNIDIFVFRCDKNSNCEQVKNYMFDNDIPVHDIECTSSDEARFRSFRVTRNRTYKDRAMDSEFWPEGVGVRYFRKKRSHFEDHNSQADNA